MTNLEIVILDEPRAYYACIHYSPRVISVCRQRCFQRRFNTRFIVHILQVLLWTGVTEELIPQKIPGCAEFCPFKEFFAIVKNILPNDNEYRCSPDEERPGVDYRSAANTVTLSQYIFFSILLVFASKLTNVIFLA